MSKVNSSNSGGIGFLGLLAIAFIVLKLTGVINWSWWWVLMPLWGPLTIALAVVGVLCCIGLVCHVLAKILE